MADLVTNFIIFILTNIDVICHLHLCVVVFTFKLMLKKVKLNRFT